MKLQITSTDEIVEIGGVPVRVWEGISEKGVRCTVYTRCLRVYGGNDNSEFLRELIEVSKPQK